MLGSWVISLVIASASLDWAQSRTNTAAPSRSDLSNFKDIVSKNIFNTRRSARYTPPSTSRVRRDRPDVFALVGTMHYDKGPFAFFDGTRSDYKKVLKPDETIAGFKVTEIEPTGVKLASATNEIELRVGMQLRRQGEEWVASDRSESFETGSSSAPSGRLILQPNVASSSPDATNTDSEGDFPDPSAVAFNPDAPAGFGTEAQPQTAQTNVESGASPPPGVDPVVWRLMQQRRQQENN